MPEQSITDRPANAPRLETGVLELVRDLEYGWGRMQGNHEVGSRISRPRWRIARFVSRVKIVSHFNLDASLAIFGEPYGHLFAPAIRGSA